MEEEARLILNRFATISPGGKGFGTAIHELFKPIGGGELEPLPTQPLGAPPDLSD